MRIAHSYLPLHISRSAVKRRVGTSAEGNVDFTASPTELVRAVWIVYAAAQGIVKRGSPLVWVTEVYRPSPLPGVDVTLRGGGSTAFGA